MTGTIFDIQRASMHDGPGIRTTVFLKGCTLSCRHCHNPESISPRPELCFDRSRCAGCGACIEACPSGAQRRLGGNHDLARELCTACGACVPVCDGALTLYGRECGVAEVMREVAADEAYYESSGGGITLSGGEPLGQFEFAKALLKAARERGIHTCIETNGNAPRERYEELLPLVDVFLFDYKETDAKAHKKLTGADNKLILGNLDFLCRQGAKVVLRCPLVPGLNDGDKHLKGIAAIARKYPKLVGIEVMPYHDMGRGKARGVGREWVLGDLPTAEEAQKQKWLKRLKALGCKKARLS